VKHAYFVKKTMTKQELIQVFIKNHEAAAAYIGSLPHEQLHYTPEGKWSAGQQLQHISLTIEPFPKALASKEYLQQKFGSIGRPTWDYETVLRNYYATSLKAPVQFVPQQELMPGGKEKVMQNIQNDLEQIGLLLNGYSEEELDVLVAPHPLLGKLTLREMFFLMGYHPLHHVKQIRNMLEQAEEIKG